MARQQVIENILQYRFRNSALLDEALTADGCGPSKSRENARAHGHRGLALIGDALLDLILIDDGICQGNSLGKPHNILYPRLLVINLAIATCHGIRCMEVSNKSLRELLRKLHLETYIKTPKCQKGRITTTIGASTIEALIGAIWVDSGRDLSKVHHAVHTLTIGASLLKNAKHDFGDERHGT